MLQPEDHSTELIGCHGDTCSTTKPEDTLNIQDIFSNKIIISACLYFHKTHIFIRCIENDRSKSSTQKTNPLPIISTVKHQQRRVSVSIRCNTTERVTTNRTASLLSAT